MIDRDEALDLLREGQTAASVAEMAGVHRTTVQRWAKQEGIVLVYPFNRHAGRDDLIDVEKIVKLRRRKSAYNKGRPLFTLQDIAEMCGCSRSYVKQVVAKARAEGRL